MQIRRIVYFDERKPENTAVTFGLARERLAALGTRKVVLASTGETAEKALAFFKDTEVKLIVVAHPPGPSTAARFSPEIVDSLRQDGHEVYCGRAPFRTDRLYESQVPVFMGNLLRCFSQGVKVCFDIVMMVTDAGLVQKGEMVICIAGTCGDADTALVMQAASSRNLKKLHVNEILCKPLYPSDEDELLNEYYQEKVESRAAR